MRIYKNSFLGDIVLSIFCLLLCRCANISAPTGGPKDTTIPKAVSYNPINNSTNFSQKTIIIKFSEKIQEIDDPEKIIVNPSLNENIALTIKKKRNLVIQFKEELNKNTTYTINLGNAIKDITEGNIATDTRYVFSTGNFIDSNRIYGSVTNLLNNQTNDKVIVGIYAITDTFDIQTDKPQYFTKPDKEGLYEINNIKSGLYKVFAFQDFNNTLLYDNNEKIIDFYDAIKIEGNNKLNFKLSKISQDSLKLLNVKESNKNEFIINLNKGIKDIIIKDEVRLWKNKISSNGKTINVYNSNFKYNDSINVNLQILDSNDITQNIYAKIIFNNISNKNLKKDVSKNLLSIKLIKPLDYKLNNGQEEILYSFSTPIKTFKIDNLMFKYDSLLLENKENISFTWNRDSTQISIKIPITFKDSLIISNKKPVFVDIFNDTVQNFKHKFSILSEKEAGKISGFITTKDSNLIVELVDEKYQMVEKSLSKTNFEFNNVRPGKYFIRIILDENNNKKWDGGNIKFMKKAEDIIFYENPINLKADWEINDINIKF